MGQAQLASAVQAMFQSLFKDYNLSDAAGASSARGAKYVSIPLQGLQPFGRLGVPFPGHPWLGVSIPLQGLQPFGRTGLGLFSGRMLQVSIPLQRLQPFELGWLKSGYATRNIVLIPLQGLQPFGLWKYGDRDGYKQAEFQSLFKDYNLSDSSLFRPL